MAYRTAKPRRILLLQRNVKLLKFRRIGDTYPLDSDQDLVASNRRVPLSIYAMLPGSPAEPDQTAKTIQVNYG